VALRCSTRDEPDEEKPNTGLAPVLCQSPVGARLAGEGVIMGAARLKAAFAGKPAPTVDFQ
jgi:hypothetical protein